MSFEEMKGILNQMIIVNQQLQSKQVKHDEWFSEMRTGLAETKSTNAQTKATHDEWFAEAKAITESNARLIEASVKESRESHKGVEAKIAELARIVERFAEVTNSRLARLENRE